MWILVGDISDSWTPSVPTTATPDISGIGMWFIPLSSYPSILVIATTECSIQDSGTRCIVAHSQREEGTPAQMVLSQLELCRESLYWKVEMGFR